MSGIQYSAWEMWEEEKEEWKVRFGDRDGIYGDRLR
jgi:hypothetical protein